MSRLQGKTALITGGGSGIGLASARGFLAEGANVVLAGRDEAKLRKALQSLAHDGQVLHQAADVSKPDQVEALVRHAVERFGGIDILLNNAGVNIKERTFRELTPESWQRIISANLDGAFYCMRAVLPHLLRRGGGLIININSISGLRATPLGGTAYVASKFGMLGLALSLGAEEKDHGIRVCSICPGEVNTPILDARPQPLSAEHLQKILQPEDVAQAVLFVATLPPHVNIPELVITPTSYAFL
jgi:NAD(P)-dependent dehydrogenase (short-subunit alcohol dehydrogenase family)